MLHREPLGILGEPLEPSGIGGGVLEGCFPSLREQGIGRRDALAGSQRLGRLSGIPDRRLDGDAIEPRDRVEESAGFLGPTGRVPVGAGEYEVVLSQECVATIAMFLGAYGFNAKVYDEGMSFVDMDTRQFDESFTMVDDALDGRGLAVPFDSEGTSRRRVELVVGGVTKGLTHDRRTAKKAGVESTGNALPGGDTFGPTATQVFVDQGEQTVDDMIAGVERGLYVATFNYCRVLDPKSLAVTGLTRNGTFVIENGKITGAVNGLRFTQSFVEALGPDRILGLGNDARWADSEFGPGMIHSPSVRLSSWNLTGGTDG